MPERFFVQRDGLVEVNIFALVIEAGLERVGQVIQVVIAFRMSFKPHRNGLTTMSYALFQIVNDTVLV